MPIVTVCVMAILLAGCSNLQLNLTVQPSTYDVPMYGRNAERVFYDSARFTFPLVVAAEYDATAGFAQSPMMIVGATMFIGTLRAELHAVNLETGKRLGYLKTYSPVSATPLLYKNLLVYGTETGKENLVAYNLTVGDVRWIRDLGGVVSSPLVHNDLLIAAGLNGRVVAFDEYGTEIWGYDMKSPVRSSPAASGDAIFCASTKGEIVALSAADGTVRWKASAENAVYAGITVWNGNVIAGSRDSCLYVLDASSGGVKRKIFLGDKIMATPSVRHGMVYTSTLEGKVFACSVETGERLWEFSAESAVNTTPFITERALFVASLDKHLYAVDPATGAVLWKYQMPARLKSTPLVWKKSLYIAAEDRIVYRFVSAE